MKRFIGFMFFGAFVVATPLLGEAVVTVNVGAQSKPISRDLFGIFFEDINYAADGGLYAELVQNRSFEYTPGDNKQWHALTAWEQVRRGGGSGRVEVRSQEPIHANNPNYAVLAVERAGEGVGLANAGFGGIPLKAGGKYDVSLFARRLAGEPVALAARLERKDGRVLAETAFSVVSEAWGKHVATLCPQEDEPDARLVVLARSVGTVALDMVSLFPQVTFRNRPNGLRADLAQVIADLKPRFVRFPGGCLAHGDGLDNIYRWKDTIGPVERRKAQRNIWRYHQTLGLGYFEYFQFCEDIGAKPLPVVAAGVCCQNAGHYLPGAPKGQQCIPMDEMAAYVQEVLDLIEYANGPVTSAWGARRAADGHPKPFGLEYLGVGNEDQISQGFKERFKMIADAVRAKHPEIKVIGTAGPLPDGRDFEEGWALARQEKIPLVDEHYYRSPEWFWGNLGRYDRYDRSGPAVYVGEYAAHEKDRRNTLRSALSEAAYLTALERNGDIVRLSSYAPLLARQGNTQWRPDLIYFDNLTVTPSVNYYVQQLFSLHAGETCHEVQVSDGAARKTLAVSAVGESAEGDLILKFVNGADTPLTVRFDVSAAGAFGASAECVVLSGDPQAENVFGLAPAVVPRHSAVEAGAVFEYTSPRHALTVIRLKRARDGRAAAGNRIALHPVRLPSVALGGFWRQQAKLQIEKWLPHCVRQMEAGGAGGELLNLVETAKAFKGEPHAVFRGFPWADAYVYNVAEAICLALEIDPAGDAALAAAQETLRGTLEAWIPVILAAQEKDGYIHSFHALKKQPRFTSIDDHEFYVMGYLLELGVAHVRLTGGRDRRLYGAAVRCADLLCETFGPEPKRTWKNGHAGLEYALCRLAGAVEEIDGAGKGEKYVALARHFLDHQHEIRPNVYNQSEKPAVKMREAAGHAVRATYFYTAMADMALLQGDSAYREAVDAIWANAIHKKHYLTGGVGARHKGEAFGGDYELPNDGYCESCAGCGLSFWSERMGRLHADAHYADVQERVLYNNVLGAVELSGTNFFYQNPPASGAPRHPWHACPCCVGNVPRTLLALKDMMYAVSAARDTLHVNHYAESEGVVPAVAGGAVRVRQETRYPWDGEVRFTLAPEKPADFTLALRIPDRAESALYRVEPDLGGAFLVSVNGKVCSVPSVKGYARVRRVWQAGDRVTLLLPLPVQRVRCDERVAANRGRVAVQRGPVVFSFEDADHAWPVKDGTLARDAGLKAVWRDDMLGGTMTVEGGGWIGVPNYARLNRGGWSQVWLLEGGVAGGHMRTAQ